MGQYARTEVKLRTPLTPLACLNGKVNADEVGDSRRVGAAWRMLKASEINCSIRGRDTEQWTSDHFRLDPHAECRGGAPCVQVRLAPIARQSKAKGGERLGVERRV